MGLQGVEEDTKSNSTEERWSLHSHPDHVRVTSAYSRGIEQEKEGDQTEVTSTQMIMMTDTTSVTIDHPLAEDVKIDNDEKSSLKKSCCCRCCASKYESGSHQHQTETTNSPLKICYCNNLQNDFILITNSCA